MILVLFFGSIINSYASEVSVMTYNIRNSTIKSDLLSGNKWLKQRDKEVINLILKSAPDILGVQEMSRNRGIKKDPIRYVRSELSSQYDSHKGIGGSPKDIFFKKDRFILNKFLSGASYLWPDNRSTICKPPNNSNAYKKGAKRSLSWATLTDKKSLESYFLINTHLHHGTSTLDENIRTQQILCIRNFISKKRNKLPVILLGDFNAEFGHRAMCSIINPTKENDLSLYSATDRNTPTYNKFCRDCVLTKKLDYVFLRGYEVINVNTIRNSYSKLKWPSDHFPVLATIKAHINPTYNKKHEGICD